ncbi:Tctex-1 [Pyrenochaeta sp. DS3sAY3a]|nr:Tctex-1 [Pyrenochaeta sp. DS3sAY3a]
MTSPLPSTELEQIARSACEKAIGTEATYDHTKVAEWNTTIIQTVLQDLIAKTSRKVDGEETAQPGFKYIANSTIIQHIGVPSEPEKQGRRGMHSAVGAYWNNEKDGTYSFKWEAGEKKGMDIVVIITWIAI